MSLDIAEKTEKEWLKRERVSRGIVIAIGVSAFVIIVLGVLTQHWEGALVGIVGCAYVGARWEVLEQRREIRRLRTIAKEKLG